MTTIYYFSGTGNSYMIAQLLAQQLGAGTELIKITPDISRKAVLRGYCGIIFPVYYTGLPHIIEQFLEHAAIEEAEYLFAIATMGNISGGALSDAGKILARKGCSLQAAYDIKMPDNYAPMFDTPSPKQQTEMFEQAKLKVALIADNLRSQRQTPIPSGNFLLKLYHQISCHNMQNKDRKFSVNNSCTACGKCALHCPAGNIYLENSRPVFRHQCEFCFSCYHHCPQNAINCGKRTEKRTRYLNPVYR